MRKNTRKIVTSELGMMLCQNLMILKKKISQFFFVFNPFSKLLVFWKIVFCFFLTFEIFSMTVKLFFQKNWDLEFLKNCRYYEFMIFLMITDLLITLNTAIYKNGIMITDRKQILKHYLQTEFFFEVPPLIVFNYQINTSPEGHSAPAALLVSLNYALKLFFLLKFRQIGNILYFFENVFHFNELWDGVFSLINLFGQILMISHLISCCWNLVGLSSNLAGEASWYDGVFTAEELNSQWSWPRVYLSSSYWSVMTMITVGYGDISSKNDTEKIVAILAMLFGCGFFAYAINNIGLIIESINLKRKTLRFFLLL